MARPPLEKKKWSERGFFSHPPPHSLLFRPRRRSSPSSPATTVAGNSVTRQLFRRSLLQPRRPGSHDPSLDRLYVPLSFLPPPPSPDQEAAVNHIYYITAKDIAQIQTAAGGRRTKIEAFTAYLWRVLARGAHPDDKVCSMGAVVDGRSRLDHGGEMAGYFGNVLSIPYGSLRVEKLKDMELAEVAEVVHRWLRVATTEEHFRGLVD